jgi:hypothetical protein
MLTLALYCWITGRPRFAGIAFGLAILTRAVLLPFMIVLLALYAWRRSKSLLVMPLVACAVVIPWTVRNLIVMHQPIVVNTEGWGSTLLQGTLYVPFRTWVPWAIYKNDPAARDATDSTADESDAERKMSSYAITRIRRHPVHWLFIRMLQYPRLYLDTGALFTELTPNYPRAGNAISILFVLGSAVFLVIAIAGAWMVRRRSEALPLLSLVVFWAIIHFPGIAQPRYSLPITPELVLFASVAIVRTVERRESAPGRFL